MNSATARVYAEEFADGVKGADLLMARAIALSANRLRALDLGPWTLKALKRELKDVDGRSGQWRTQ